MNKNPNRHSIRRIVLPSGRTIEVVRFTDVDDSGQQELHICPACASELVQPVTWAEAPHQRWELTLHCPNCDRLIDGVFGQKQVYDLEEKLDAGLADMLSDLRRLTQSNMAEDIDRFAAALHADMILPEDF